MGAKGLKVSNDGGSRGILLTDRSLGVLILAFPVLLLLCSSTIASGQNQVAYDGPGFDFSYPEEHRLFLKGDEDYQFLDRNWTTVTGLPTGSASFSKTSSLSNPTIIDSSAPPLQEPFRFEGNITVQLYASLETTSEACSVTNLVGGTALGSETQFFVTLSMGGIEALSGVQTESIVMKKDRTDPHIFEARATNVNVSMNSGDEISLSIQVKHECAISGTLWWGTYDARSGVIFDGDIIETRLNVILDQNRMARFEFTPISPWGPDDFSAQAIELIGPIEWDEMRHGYHEEDIWQDHFELPHGFSKGESNRTVLTWSTERPLKPGNYMVDACFTVTDQDPGESCDSWALLRFAVPPDSPPLLSSSVAAFLVPLFVLGWIATSLKGTTLPLPAFGVVLLLALASIGPAASLPDIENAALREDGAAPSFLLLSHDPEVGAISLSDLLQDSDVVVIGLFTSGSPNAMRQKGDFETASVLLDQDGIEPSFVQIATGEGLQAFNLDEYSNDLNGSWPLLLDDSTVGRALPSGATDAVIVVDSAGFVSDWNPGTMSPADIQVAANEASMGSGKSPLGVFSMLIGTAFLPLLILAMPSERRYESPKEALIPGVGGMMTIFASSLGFLVLALPVSICSGLGLGAYWLYVELVLAAALVYHGASMLIRGRVWEIEKSSFFAHSRLPVQYREWRGSRRFSEDVYLGLWMAWLVWLRDPSMVPQGVGSVARTGLLGAMLSPLLLIGFAICAGVAVVVIRSVALLPGKNSRILGLISVGVRPRAWGLVAATMGLWVLVSIIVGPLLASR
ncbi:MAG TPA: hypothetical protein QF641_00455 [Candidatus Thalassarchaeaceae archaeon]|nr:hypothetical protein [Candidatus Thalassarchaeaceae archaeon]|tara:strand:+ start:11093 stop:13483 length:2391 start_codon:yes stop_codon:yes gene_type:complete